MRFSYGPVFNLVDPLVWLLIRSTLSSTSTLTSPTNIPSTLEAGVCARWTLEQASMGTL